MSGPHEVGQRARPGRGHPQLVAHRLDRLQVEPGAHDDVGQRVPSPVGEEAPGDGVTGDGALVVAVHDAEHDRCLEGERVVQVREREPADGPDGRGDRCCAPTPPPG